MRTHKFYRTYVDAFNCIGDHTCSLAVHSLAVDEVQFTLREVANDQCECAAGSLTQTPPDTNTRQQLPAFVDHCSDPRKRPPIAATSSHTALHTGLRAAALVYKMSEDPQQKYPAYKLGEYTVVGEIAEGTFGKVKSKSCIPPFRLGQLLIEECTVAVHTVTGQKVAMKFISKQAIAKHRTKTRVQREVEYMRTLRHPHIIKLYVRARCP